MALKLLAEKHIAISITDQLEAKGVDVVRAEEVGLSHADDDVLLAFAVAEGRVIVTHDSDFARLHREYMEQGKTHCGIMYVTRRFQGVIGVVVTALMFWHEAVEAGAAVPEQDIHNRLIYIP